MRDFEKHKKNFFSFLDKIKYGEKIGIIAHANCVDGMASVVFLVEILKKKYPHVSDPLIDFVPYSIGALDKFEQVYNKEGIKKVFILDFNADIDMFDELVRFQSKFDVCFIDHHPLNPKLKIDEKIIKTEKEDCTALVMYHLGDGIIDEKEWVWLACVAGVSEFSWHKEENLKFIQNHYPLYKPGDEESDLLKFVHKMGSLVVYYSNDSIKAYEIILRKDFERIEEINKEVWAEMERCLNDFEENAESYFEGKLYFYLFESRFAMGSKMSTILSVRHRGSTIITFSELEGTDMLKVSTRNNGNPLPYLMNDMLGYGVKGLERAMGAGHPNASGGSFLKKDLDEFKERIKEFVKTRLEIK